jgi:O-acetylserine/cysteine efflux transporter
MNVSLPPRFIALAVLVAFVWGTNFVVIKWALAVLPPFLFAALRFALAAFPALLFIPKPNVSWGNLALYGLLIGAGQFGIMLWAMREQISPGLASLVIQTQVFFTIMISMLRLGERLRALQVVALIVAASGILILLMNTGGSVTGLGLIAILIAAMAWACGNIVAREAGAGAQKKGSSVNMLAYVIWSSLFAVPPLVALSLLLEGWPAISAALANATAPVWAAVLWQSVGNTLFGYAAWAWLLSRFAASAVSPWALLVPVFGMGASALWLNESLPAWKLIAALCVLSGLALNVWAMRRRA